MKTLVKSNGLPSLRSMMEDFWNVDDFFNKPIFNKEQLPAVNIKNKKDQYEIEVSAPGFNKQDFNISVENGLLNISAETTSQSEENFEDYTRKEFSTSSFSRSFKLPNNIFEDQVNASYKNGLLHITIKKTDEVKKAVKKIEIA